MSTHGEAHDDNHGSDDHDDHHEEPPAPPEPPTPLWFSLLGACLFVLGGLGFLFSQSGEPIEKAPEGAASAVAPPPARAPAAAAPSPLDHPPHPGHGMPAIQPAMPRQLPPGGGTPPRLKP